MATVKKYRKRKEKEGVAKEGTAASLVMQQQHKKETASANIIMSLMKCQSKEEIFYTFIELSMDEKKYVI